ncbi:MAG: ABC transporter ATP-binding protein [Clostridia bacterium]|nr:ABC transporter ATP-binding protein [Clostridia bacterium]
MKKRDRNPDIQYEGNALVRLLAYMKPHLASFFVCLLLVLVVTALDLYRPTLIGNAIDQYITVGDDTPLTVEERFSGVLRSGGIYAVILLLLFICNRFQYLMMQKTGQQIIYDLRNTLFEHVQALTMRFFDVTPVGKIVTRLTNDVEAINDVYSNILVRLFQNSVKVIGLACIMLAMNTRLALTCFALLPLVIFLTALFRTLSRRAYQVSRTRLTTINTFLSEHLSGMRIIQIFAREKEKGDEFREKSEELYQANFREILIDAIFRPATYMTYVCSLAILLLAGASSVISGAISIGTLYIFISYLESFFNPIQELAQQFATLQSAIASSEKIFTLLDTRPDIPPDDHPEILSAVHGRVEFDHVWFAYQGEDWVLKDVSFTIEPGERVAFVGATGAGKSSILNLIGRYYDIQKGTIRIDGKDIRTLSREQIRRSIGQVQQDVFIFTGDVASNIRLRDDSISDSQVQKAAEAVNAAPMIERLSGKYQHPVSERGATFSQGERQLLSFARTLAYDPAILILDEATASIDTHTEQLIQEAIARLMQGRTCIMVAHRLSTIQNADCIMVMHHGRIRERGTHQQLLSLNGIYAKLYALQIASH